MIISIYSLFLVSPLFLFFLFELFHLIIRDRVSTQPPTQGAWTEHIRRAHVHANIWHQDMVLTPTCVNPLTLGWRYLYQKLVPVLSRVAPAPVSVLQIVRCNCQTSKCTRRCSCRVKNVICTELCKCGGELYDHYTTNDWRISKCLKQ